MNNIQIGEIELRFANTIWDNEPVSSSELVKMCEQQFSWKKSTTFTVLRRLCEKGIFTNNNGTVTSLISRGDFHSIQSECFITNTFDGSLPAFLTAFTSRKKLSPEEVEYLRKIVEEYKED